MDNNFVILSFWTTNISSAKILKLFVSFAVIFCLLLTLLSLQFSILFEEYNYTTNPYKIDVEEDYSLLNNENLIDKSTVRQLSELNTSIVDIESSPEIHTDETGYRMDQANVTNSLNIERNLTMGGLYEFQGIIISKSLNLNDPGELGRPYLVNSSLLHSTERKQYDGGWKRHGFNQYVSDHISIQRSLEDVRDSECLNITYNSSTYIDTSVIIIFFNEALSTLLRTTYSVLNKSPPHLLKEVILVDDSSEYEELQKPLQKYITQRLPQVKLIRSPRRLGLINARLYGVQAASGMSYTFLDSHCECTEGWLEPLLERVSKNWTNVAMPIINPIDDVDFKFYGPKHGYFGKNSAIGGFSWTLNFDWIPEPKSEVQRRKNEVDPVRSPTMAGGLFTIHRDFFKILGYYDPEFSLYGAENLELSFKIWMCGGILEQIPCSHVGHVFRKTTPYMAGQTTEVNRNKVRLAEVWMDDYKYYFYDMINYELGDYGNVSSRRLIRDQLHCKDFEWYLKTIYPQRYLPVKHWHFGRVNNVKLNRKCLTADFPGTHPMTDTDALNIVIDNCAFTPHNQVFAYITEDSTIRCDRYCLSKQNEELKLVNCDVEKQKWNFTKNNLIHTNTSQCLDIMNENNGKLHLTECIKDNNGQKWQWQTEAIPRSKIIR